MNHVGRGKGKVNFVAMKSYLRKIAPLYSLSRSFLIPGHVYSVA